MSLPTEHTTETPHDCFNYLTLAHGSPAIGQRGPDVSQEHTRLAEGVQVEPLESRVGAVELRGLGIT